MQDIHERCLDYAVRAVRLFQHLMKGRDEAAVIIGRQYLKSATSMGANMAEADAAETPADFVHKCAVSQKEGCESQFWLKLLSRAELVAQERIEPLTRETEELTKIITAIGRNAKRRMA